MPGEVHVGVAQRQLQRPPARPVGVEGMRDGRSVEGGGPGVVLARLAGDDPGPLHVPAEERRVGQPVGAADVEALDLALLI